jgi:putative phage-type endonuclease
MKVLTAEQRREGLGATDVATIVGVSSYRAPIEVWAEKTGEGQPQPQSWRMRMGQLLEDGIAEAYTEQTGRKLVRIGVVYHRDYPFLYCHPDRRIVGEPGLVEIKATEHRRDYDNGVPPRVQVQCQFQMAITGRLFVDVAVLAGTTSGIDTIRIDRDQELIDALVTEAARFWNDYVLTGIRPPADGTEAYRRYLTSQHPKDSGDELVATPEQQLLLDELQRATRATREAESHRQLLENRLREAMGDATRLIAPSAVVTWRQENPRTPWKDVAEQIADKAGIDIEEAAQAAKAGLERPRVLRVSWKGEPA